MSSSHGSDPKKLPVPRPARSDDILHQNREWASGTRGGGSLKPDFTWPTSPKQKQEENGSGDADQPISK